MRGHFAAAAAAAAAADWRFGEWPGGRRVMPRRTDKTDGGMDGQQASSVAV